MARLKLPDRNRFIEFINHMGIYNLSARLGVASSTVYRWVRFSTKPEPDTAIKIIELAQGELTFDDVYFPYFAKEYPASCEELTNSDKEARIAFLAIAEDDDLFFDL